MFRRAEKMVSEESPETIDGEVATTLAQFAVSVNRRFDTVDAAIVEQRQYTDFAFTGLDTRLARVEQDVSTLKQDVSALKGDVGVLKQDVSSLKQDMSIVKGGIGRLERKLDQLVDRQPHVDRPEPDAGA